MGVAIGGALDSALATVKLAFQKIIGAAVKLRAGFGAALASIGPRIQGVILQFRAMQAEVLKTAGSLKVIGVVGAKSLGLAAFAKLKTLLASLPALAAGAAKGFLALAATLGPMLLLVGATTALMEAIAAHRRINASTRAFKEFLTEAEKVNLKVLKAQAANNQEVEADIDLREQRLEQIRREQGFFTRWIEDRLVQFGKLTLAERQLNKETENYVGLLGESFDKQLQYNRLIEKVRDGYKLSDDEVTYSRRRLLRQYGAGFSSGDCQIRVL